MLIATAAILLTAVLSTITYYQVFKEEVMEDLAAYTRLLRDMDAVNDRQKLEHYASELSLADIRLTVILRDGSVLFDNMVADELENHNSRAEIISARETGEGSSIRKSDTIQATNFYYAIRLSDGTILRTAKKTNSIINLFAHAFPIIAIIAAVILLLCFVASHFLTKSILRPIETVANSLDDGNLPDTYRELSPILSHIRSQHAEILENTCMRQEFTANVSHELKTPLSAISGYSELIENGMASQKDTQKFAGEIHRNAERLLALINDILRLSELDTKQASNIQTEDVDLYDTLLTCQIMLEPVARKADITLQVSGESTIIRVNRTMLEEIVYNLCDNAIRYNRPGGNVWLSATDRTLTVADDGIGIPEEYRDRIFERFFRVDKSRSKKTGGTGLGLAIVKHSVMLSGATISVNGNEYGGTTIVVHF